MAWRRQKLNLSDWRHMTLTPPLNAANAREPEKSRKPSATTARGDGAPGVTFEYAGKKVFLGRHELRGLLQDESLRFTLGEEHLASQRRCHHQRRHGQEEVEPHGPTPRQAFGAVEETQRVPGHPHDLGRHL